MEDADTACNSRKAWSLIKKLGNDHTKPTTHHRNITANQIAYQLLLNGKAPRSSKQPKPKICEKGFGKSRFLKPFSADELVDGINNLNNGKAIGLENIFT